MATTPSYNITIDPLLRMAVQYPVDHPVHKTMIHYAQVIQARDATESADSTQLRDRFNKGSLTAEQITVAAEGLPVPKVDMEDLPVLTRRIAWREVLHRDDVLAEQCVSLAHKWNGGKDTTHPHTINIRRTAAGREFISRLQPTPRCAMFIILDPDRKATPMVDPLTDSPVAVPTNEDERISASAPNALPTTSPLAELILEHPIWIRTADGTVYPAPYHSYYGLSWGYPGTGPATLATLIWALLNDITAYGADPTEGDHTPDGLFKLIRHKWPDGTVLTRDQLEAACNDHPEIPE